jgi:hypothetical protein
METPTPLDQFNVETKQETSTVYVGHYISAIDGKETKSLGFKTKRQCLQHLNSLALNHGDVPIGINKVERVFLSAEQPEVGLQ